MTDSIVVVTGTRRGRPDVVHWLDRWRRKYGPAEWFVLGDSNDWTQWPGVDGASERWCRANGQRFIRERALAELRSPHRFRERDERMAEHIRGEQDWCLAFPDGYSKGTWLTLRLCRERGAK